MPYIKANDGRRESLQKGDTAQSAGELNYQIFYYVKHAPSEFDINPIIGFVKKFLGTSPNYQKWNDLTGCLVRCSREIDRRGEGVYLKAFYAEALLDIMDSYDEEINIYEQKKQEENSDVE